MVPVRDAQDHGVAIYHDDHRRTATYNSTKEDIDGDQPPCFHAESQRKQYGSRASYPVSFQNYRPNE
jgi:hypothetical protein